MNVPDLSLEDALNGFLQWEGGAPNGEELRSKYPWFERIFAEEKATGAETIAVKVKRSIGVR